MITRASYEAQYQRLLRECNQLDADIPTMTNQELIASINSALRFLNCIPMTASEVNYAVITLNKQNFK